MELSQDELALYFPTSDLATALVEVAERRVRFQWFERIVAHLAERRARELREGLPVSVPSNEQTALALIKQQADFHMEYATAFREIAKSLKEDGRGFRASQAYKAALIAEQRARDLIG